MAEDAQINPEELAYWYFRLNGCLTIKNFVIHPDWGSEQRTDIDIIAVRFPHRAELLRNPMRDDRKTFPDPIRIRIILAEVKTGRCDLNGPWLNQKKRNMQHALRAIGAFPKDMANSVSAHLYKTGSYRDSQYHISLLCLGSHVNQRIRNIYPEVPQLMWDDDVLLFIYERFRRYSTQKESHPQWDKVGKHLWTLATARSFDFNEFRQAVISRLGSL